MGLFKDFKEDFSQAAREMMPGTDEPKNKKVDKPERKTDDLVVNTLGENVDVKSELSKLDGLLDQVNKKDEQPAAKSLEEELTPMNRMAQMNRTAPKPQSTPAPMMNEEKKTMDKTMNTIHSGEVADETSVITAGTVLTGDLASDGSFDIQGTINGNVTCNGKLVVTGTINGNSAASEFFADVAKIEGEIVSSGTVKIGAGSVIIGNISAASAVIAGAIKGDIDVQGPVVVDTSAVVMGNIKSRSVQINNGAVIEGFCSQCYAEVDVQGLFDGN